ncbi:hypothetical protein ES705_26933 [subsurface metagenome]
MPNYARIEVMEEIVDAVKAGAELKGVICEKPLARTVAEAQILLALAAEVNLNTSYHENQLHMKAIQNALNQLEPEQRVMGPISLARSAEEHSGPHHGSGIPLVRVVVCWRIWAVIALQFPGMCLHRLVNPSISWSPFQSPVTFPC